MISLKAYNQEIEQLIENGLYDDAIAHSIHILSTYPKCIDSYRNLGKSLLEQKKYPEALDVFSRVLSAIPDDFISHVGLSIIFEDQNNLDLAIWHMEQAFDVQPSNLAIQDELKRLFGLRDGDQPTKIRLTRGALVRMYARGELFQQAITEILSILEEDPRRIDLEVILARMHYFSGSTEESELDCNRILEKIPYCFEANRVLHQIHINNNEQEAAAINMNRLISLDPYYQFFAAPFSEQEIPENKVLIEKLDYIPSSNTGSHIPEWLEDFNFPAEKKPSETFNWINDSEKPDESNSNSSTNPFPINDKTMANSVDNNSMQSNDEIPDWIKTAGWNSNSGSDSNENTEKLNKDHFEEQSANPENLSENEPITNSANVTNDDLASLFSELKEGKMNDENQAANGNEENNFPPSDWMSQFSTSNGSTSSDSSDQDFPDWLKNFQDEEPQISQASADMPDWLINLQKETDPVAQPLDEITIDSPTEEIISEETIFDNIFVQEDEPEVFLDITKTTQEISDKDDGWEKIDLFEPEIEEPVISTLETDELKPLSSDDKIPDWVKSVLINQDPVDQSPQKQEIEPDLYITDDIKASTIVPNTSQKSSEIAPNSDEGIISQQTNDELLDWLRGLKTEEEPAYQNGEDSDTLQTSSNVSLVADLPLNLEVQPSDDLQLRDDSLNHELDQQHSDPKEVEQYQLPSEKEMLSEPDKENGQTLLEEVEYTEYANEMTETPSADEPVKNIHTSELNYEALSENITEISNGSLNDLVNSGDFDTLTAAISKFSSQNQEIESLITKLTGVVSENGNNFAYWQCLGDIYSKNDQLNDALCAYQKAEDILLKTISS